MRLATIHLLVAGLGLGILPPRAAGAACPGPLLHWTDTYDVGSADQALAAAVDPSGNVYAAGYVTVGGQGANWVVRKYAPDGGVLWTQTYNNPSGNGDDFAQSVAVAPGGDVVVAGLDFTGTSYDWLVRRYTAAGALVWSVGYNGPANGVDEPRAVAIAPTGEIWVGGYETRSDLLQGQNWLVRKYSAAGGLLGSWSYNGPASLDDFVEALAVDGAGNVYVGGNENRTDLGQDMNWRIVKYDASGVFQWADTWNSPAGGYDLAHAIAVGNGEVTVAGHEDRPDLVQGRNWRVRRYTDAGALRWSVGYDGGIGFDDVYGVAMDALGNAYLSGYAETAAGVQTWRTVRYSPGGAADWAIAEGIVGSSFGVAVDPGGAVAVAGFSGSGLVDLHVRRYRQPVCLAPVLAVSPATVSVGQIMTVVFTVTNAGGAWTGVLPQAWATGAGGAAPASGPAPAGASLALGGAASFTWTFTATAAGAVTFTASAGGWDDAVGATVYTAAAVGALVQRPAAITGVIAVSPATVRPGDAVILVLTVSNSGDAATANLRPALRPGLAGAATGYLALGPDPAGPVSLAGGATTAFTWVMTAGLASGSFTLTASATGSDANAGFPVTTGLLGAAAVTVASAVEPCPATGANILTMVGRSVSGPDEGHAIALAPSGSIFVAGAEDREDISHQQDVWIISTPPGGVTAVNNDYGSAASVPDIGYGVAWLPSREVVAVGRAAERFWMGRYTDGGALVWQATPPPAAAGPDELRAVAGLPGGDVVVAGTQRRTDLGQGDNLHVARYTAAGAVVWSLNYNDAANGDDAGFAVAVDGAGNIYAAGYETRTDLGQDRNIVVLKIGPGGGAPVWVRSYSSGPGNRDEARGIAVDAAGNVVVCGFETRADLGQGENGWVGRWSAAGTPLWTATFNSPLLRTGGPADRAMGVALDPAGAEAFVTGRVERAGQGANILLRRYATATGAVIEEELRNGPAGNKDDEGHGIARGTDGNLYVTGFENWDHVSQGHNLVIHRWTRPGCLHAALAVSQSPVSVGQTVTVTLTVTSTASNPVTTVVPALAIGPGGALVVPLSGPVPGSVASLPPGASVSFVWTFSASGAGLVWFTGTATGTESGSGLPVSASASATLVIQLRAGLAVSLAMPPTACTGQVIAVVATVTNTGQAGATSVAPVGDPVIGGAGGLALLAGPGPVTMLAGGTAWSLTWTYSVTAGGSADLTLTVTGAEANSGDALVAGPVTTGPVAIGAPAGLVAAAAAPGIAAVGTLFTVTLTVTNTGAGGASGLIPQAGVSPGGAPVAPVGGPSPAGPTTIAPAATQVFAWTFTATGWGAATFTLTAVGADSCGPARTSATVTVLLGTPAALVASVVSALPDPVCPGAAVRIVVSVTNTGQVPAQSVRSVTPYVEGLAVLVAVPAWIPTLAGGASAHLTWTFSPTAAGPLRFTTTVLGFDARDSGPVATGPLATPILTVSTAAALVSSLAAPATVVAGNPAVVTLTVTNTGGQDAVNVVAALSAAAGAMATPVSGPSPAGPVTIPPGGTQIFSWTRSVSGAGTVAFTATAAGQTCSGTAAVATVAGAALTVWRPAQLVADSLTLTPSSVQAPGIVTAVLALRNAGDASLVVEGLLRAVSGGSTTGLLAASPALTPALSVTIAGNATALFTWTHGVVLPCGIGSVIASATGYESATGRPLASGSIASGQVAVTGAPASLAVTPSATAALVSTPVTISAVVRDLCGLAVPNAPVSFVVLGGGGMLSVQAATTDSAGVARSTLTLGPDPGRNGVWAGVGATTLSATVFVDGGNPLTLDEPGVALDHNVLDTTTGRVVIARIYPRNVSPVAVRVFTASGRLVRTLRKLTPLGRDQFIAEWDGLTEDGFKVARGVYLVQVLGGGLSEVLKVVVR